MRFETRYDRWLVVLLVVAATATCVFLPVLAFLDSGRQPRALPVAFAPWAIWLFVIACTLPQYYEVREDGLFLRQGWRRRLIPYASLVEIQSIVDSRSAAVFSSQRMLLVTRENRRFLIAVAEEERFLTEISKRCPLLERKSFGLGTVLSSA
jgi:hypothetical protein